jgi:hypothetical protein
MKSKLSIEFSDYSYWKQLNYHDGLLYCQLLMIDGKNDWRMMTFHEHNCLFNKGILYDVQRKNYKKIKPMIEDFIWDTSSIMWNIGSSQRWIIPVRDNV